LASSPRQPTGDRDLGSRIRAARKAAGLAVKELAARLGVRPGRLVAWESGQRQPPLKYMRQIASACGADLDWMLTGERVPSADVPWETRFERVEEEMRALRALVSAIAERPPRYRLPETTDDTEWLLRYLAGLDLEATARDALPEILAALPGAPQAVARRLETALAQALRSTLPKVLADFLEHIRTGGTPAAEP
jgi:transcriptional regulator with XRE-family HTH domain